MIILALTVLLTILTLVLSSDRVGWLLKVLVAVALGWLSMRLAMTLPDAAHWNDEITEDRR